MNILFFCTANRDRSRTADIHFQNKYPEHRFRSAGINGHFRKQKKPPNFSGGFLLKIHNLD